MSNKEYCIMCGDDIPEGRQVCPNCEKEVNKMYHSCSAQNNTKENKKIAAKHVKFIGRLFGYKT